MTEDVLVRIRNAATEIDGVEKLSCKRAFQLAEELELSLKDIGNICNSVGIKIINCQLGCFL